MHGGSGRLNQGTELIGARFTMYCRIKEPSTCVWYSMKHKPGDQPSSRKRLTQQPATMSTVVNRKCIHSTPAVPRKVSRRGIATIPHIS